MNQYQRTTRVKKLRKHFVAMNQEFERILDFLVSIHDRFNEILESDDVSWEEITF